MNKFDKMYQKIVLNEGEETVKLVDITKGIIMNSVKTLIENAIKELNNKIIGERTKELLAAEMWQNLEKENMTQNANMATIETFIDAIVKNLEETLKKGLTEGYKEVITNTIDKEIDNVIKAAAVNVEFNDEKQSEEPTTEEPVLGSEPTPTPAGGEPAKGMGGNIATEPMPGA